MPALNLTQEQQKQLADSIQDELLKFLEAIFAEGERAAIILGAARLDMALQSALQSLMHHNPGGVDNLFGADRPLGSLSAKISLAYGLGIYGRDFEHALQMIRKIRNDCAHTLEDGSILARRHRDRLAMPLGHLSIKPFGA